MKRMILMAVMVLAALVTMQGQVVNTERVMTEQAATALQPDSVTPNGEWQKVIETTLTGKEGFKYAQQVLARIVPDYQRRVKLQDETDLKIVCEVPLKLLEFFTMAQTQMMLTGSYMTTMTFIFKDGRYKVAAEDVKCTYQLKQSIYMVDQARNEAFYSTNVKTGKVLQKDMKEQAGWLLFLFSKALEKQKTDNDF